MQDEPGRFGVHVFEPDYDLGGGYDDVFKNAREMKVTLSKIRKDWKS